MSMVESLALLLVVVWGSILTMAVLVLVREIAILRIRLELMGNAASRRNDGLDLGRPVPAEVLQALPMLSTNRVFVLIVSSICSACVELAPQFRERRLPVEIKVLLTGTGVPADALAAEFPGQFTILRDPLATPLAKALAVQSTPFVLAIEHGRVVGKAYVHTVRDFERLIAATEKASTRGYAAAEPALEATHVG